MNKTTPTRHNLVYKITNTVNKKYYFGVHSTNNLDDGYMGSGKVVKMAIRAYGIENFEREILFDFPDRTSALKKESALITKEHLENEMCYNLAQGGGDKPKCFSKKANKIKCKLFEPYDNEYEYQFVLNEPKYNIWKNYHYMMRPIFEAKWNKMNRTQKKKNMQMWMQTLMTETMIEYFGNCLRAMQRMYNNIYKHGAMVEMIKNMEAKNIGDCFIIHKVKREING